MIAVRLANLLADVFAATRNIEKRITRAKMEGAAEAAHELGYGMTPFNVWSTVAEWVKAHPRPQAGMAFNGQRIEWTKRVEDELTPLLEALR